MEDANLVHVKILADSTWHCALCVAVLQLLWLVVILGVMVGLYISPLYILCPCITTSPSMPHKPKLFAHRGAEGVSPDVYALCCLSV